MSKNCLWCEKPDGIKRPKHKKVKLYKKDYQLLREQVYFVQGECCAGCEEWLPFDEFSLHHWDRAIGDVFSNVTGFCLKCHPS